MMRVKRTVFYTEKILTNKFLQFLKLRIHWKINKQTNVLSRLNVCKETAHILPSDAEDLGLSNILASLSSAMALYKFLSETNLFTKNIIKYY